MPEVEQREWDIGVERPARLDRALHEVDRPPDDLFVDLASLFEVVDDELATLLALAAFHNVHEWGAERAPSAAGAAPANNAKVSLRSGPMAVASLSANLLDDDAQPYRSQCAAKCCTDCN